MNDLGVARLMTPAAGLVAVPGHATAARVDAVAADLGIRHVFVADDGHLRGLLCRCDLQARDRRSVAVEELMVTRFWSVAPDTGLLEAASVMAERKIGCLPVVAGDELIGVVTRGDLRRAGVAETLLGAGRCASCGDVHGVLPLWDGAEVEFCLSCAEIAREPIDDSELGTAD